jgi:hypothetical protein
MTKKVKHKIFKIPVIEFLTVDQMKELSIKQLRSYRKKLLQTEIFMQEFQYECKCKECMYAKQIIGLMYKTIEKAKQIINKKELKETK